MSRHGRLEELFLAALDVPDAEREAWIARQTADDPTLAAELRELLDSDSRSGRFESPFFPSTEEPPPAIDGPYRLIRRIGEGGFGTVWEAEQTAPVTRRVAIKILKAGMDSRAVLARFAAERQALAIMDHPGVARVYDAGVTKSGRSFFVMELVDGPPITIDCERNARSLEERLTLFAAVCRAVEHAHRRGVIHRDLKPSNVLVTTVDGRPVPKVIDFGIAKALAADAGEATLTRPGEILGTPEYMSPEQAASGGADVDTRSDVYSLGVLLYRLLTGVLPFEPERLRAAGPTGIVDVLAREEPPRMSDRVRRNAPGDRSGSGTSGERALRGDLDWIAAKAMEKDRDRRYASPAALAEDIERHLAHEPVTAGPPGSLYRARKLARRHRGLVTGALAVFIALLLGLVTTALQAVRAGRAETEARRQAETAEQVNAFLTRMLAAANPEANPGGRDVTVREIVDRAAAEVSMALPPDVEAGVRHALAVTYMGLSLYPEADREIDRAVALRPALDGPGLAAALDSRLVRAELFLDEDRFGAAHEVLSETAPRVDHAGADAPALRARLEHLQGLLFSEQDHLDAADSVLVRAVAGRRALEPPDPSGLAASLAALAEIRANRGLAEEALPFAEEAVTVTEAAHGRHHHDTAVAWGHLALLMRRMGRYAEAESLYRASIDVDRAILGPDHPFPGETLSNLGIVIEEQGRPVEAEATYREALRILRAGLGDDHHLVTTVLGNLATAVQDQGRYGEALAIRKDVLDRQRRLHPGDHEVTAIALNNLGSLYRLMKRYDDAVTVFEEARGIFTRTRGADHPNTVTAENNIGKTLYDAGRYAEAEPMLKKASEDARRVFPAGHPTAAAILGNYGLDLAALGRIAAAESTLTAAHAALAASLGPGHPKTKEIEAGLASLNARP